MPGARKYSFINEKENNTDVVEIPSSRHMKNADAKKQFKKELFDVFRKFGYLGEGKDYEVKFRTTSGNIAWVHINSIETIK